MSRPDEDVLVGGNHLASAFMATGYMPNDFKDYESVLAICGQPWADIWVCWKAIMAMKKAKKP